MDRDRKSPALKELQGRHLGGGLRRRASSSAQVFDDVPRAFARWRGEDVRLGIFSSGSVLAQQWLFRRSSAGDLTPFLALVLRHRTSGRSRIPAATRGSPQKSASCPPRHPVRLRRRRRARRRGAAGLQARSCRSAPATPRSRRTTIASSRSFDEIYGFLTAYALAGPHDALARHRRYDRSLRCLAGPQRASDFCLQPSAVQCPSPSSVVQRAVKKSTAIAR